VVAVTARPIARLAADEELFADLTSPSVHGVLGAALDYARRGWPVLPLWWPLGENRCACPDRGCQSPGKHPRAAHGVHDATVELDRIERWWTRHPDDNVGLATGAAFDVLDLDRPQAGQWLAEYADDHGEDTEEGWGWGPMTTTGKGSHLLYEPTGGVKGVRLALR
jgi:hypothetical protein